MAVVALTAVEVVVAVVSTAVPYSCIPLGEEARWSAEWLLLLLLVLLLLLLLLLLLVNCTGDCVVLDLFDMLVVLVLLVFVLLVCVFVFE